LTPSKGAPDICKLVALSVVIVFVPIRVGSDKKSEAHNGIVLPVELLSVSVVGSIVNLDPEVIPCDVDTNGMSSNKTLVLTSAFPIVQFVFTRLLHDALVTIIFVFVELVMTILVPVHVVNLSVDVVIFVKEFSNEIRLEIDAFPILVFVVIVDRFRIFPVLMLVALIAP
jgi:hypothetical protein